MRSQWSWLFGAMTVVLLGVAAHAADWTQFRGPGGLGVSEETGLPARWSSEQNIVWKAEMPGPGASSPITTGGRVFVTCYSGYGLEPGQGDQQDLRRHLLALDRKSGKALWQKTFMPKLPEHKYQGEGSYHGYAASTPTTDGTRLYVFFGKSGVFCFDTDGKELWHASVGEGINGWGSGSSPLIYKHLLIVNASVESGSLVALDRMTGEEVWRKGGIRSSWNTPMLAGPQGQRELVVSIRDHVLSFDPDTGDERWRAEGVHRYVCPSVIYHRNTVYALGGGRTSLAVRMGGTGDVTESHGVWRLNKGANVSSPIYYQGHLYWTRDGTTICCQDPATGEMVYEQRPSPGAGRVWASPVLADGKLYYVSQHKGTYVVAAGPKFELLAHNVFEDDDTRTNASLAVSDGQLLLRTDRNVYCIGEK